MFAKGLEVIFVSSDRDAASFREYYSTMPWLAIPHDDPRTGKLSSLFGVDGIPSFVLINASTGNIVNGNARGNVISDPKGTKFPWHEAPVVVAPFKSAPTSPPPPSAPPPPSYEEAMANFEDDLDKKLAAMAKAEGDDDFVDDFA